jgi:hypothetical protein
MRWKLVIIVSLIAAIVAYCVWELAIAVIFGDARPIQHHDRLLVASALIPLALVIFAGVFVYRHTARKRKTQALISSVLTLLLIVSAYVAGSTLFPQRLQIPQACLFRPCL